MLPGRFHSTRSPHGYVYIELLHSVEQFVVYEYGVHTEDTSWIQQGCDQRMA